MIKESIRRSFSFKLSFWILLLAIPMFFASVGMLYSRMRTIVRDEAVQRANGVLDASLQRICRYLVTVETATNAYSWLAERYVQPDSLTAFAYRVVHFNPYTDGCVIGLEPHVLPQCSEPFITCSVRKEGDSILTVGAQQYNYFDKEWYFVPQDRKKAEWVIYQVSSKRLGMGGEGMVATYSKPLYTADHQFMGVISTDMSLLHLSDILAEEKPYPHSYFLLIDEEGRYVGHPDSTRLFSKTIFGQADLQKNKDLIALGYEMTSGHQGEMMALINNKPSLVCFKPVPGTTWSLAIVCPDSDILKAYNRFSYIVLSLLVVGLILIVLYCHRITSRAIQPIRDLLEKTQEIAKGNLDVVITRSKNTDDIGCLQNSYVTMLESLRHYMDNVRVASEKERLYNKELEEATKMVMEADRQKTLFMQNMTHQVRTPLNIIMGFAQILSTAAGEGMSEEEMRSVTGTMDHNSKLLNRLVLMLYDCSDYGVSESNLCQKHELVPANEAMREMVDYVMRVCPETHVDFETELPDDIVVATNKKYLQYSLAEVLLNAVKYSDREHIVARVARSDNGVRFVIEDTGQGIAEADRERIFKFFTKADDFSEGLGLGLPLTKRHAQTLGGDFFLDPDYHDGCRFVFELPI